MGDTATDHTKVDALTARVIELEAIALREHQRAEDLRKALREAASSVYGLRGIPYRMHLPFSGGRDKAYREIQAVGEAMTRAMVADLDRVQAGSSWDA